MILSNQFSVIYNTLLEVGLVAGLPVMHPMAIFPAPLLIKQVVYMGQQTAQFKDCIPHLLGVVSASFWLARASIFFSLMNCHNHQ